MNLYRLIIDEGKMVNIEHIVLAENFLDAVEQAKKIASKVDAAKIEKAKNQAKKHAKKDEEFYISPTEIIAVEKLYEIEVVR